MRRNARQRAIQDPTQVPVANVKVPAGADGAGGADGSNQRDINALLRPTASLLPNNFNW